MADSEKDFARFSSHNGTFHYNYLPRLNFAPDGTRNVTAPPASTYLPRQSMATENTHQHNGPLDSNYPSRRAASTEQTRHHNHLHNPSFLSRHDPGSENTRPQNSTIHHQPSYVTPNKVSSEETHDHHHCATCEANAAYNNAPLRTSSPDSFQNAGNTFPNEDMSEEAALQAIKTTQSVNMSPELFEKLYLNPQTVVSGDLRKTFANPTPIALIGYVLTLTPLSCAYMGWRGAEASGAATVGVYYFMGGLLMLLGGILEFFLGNTFSSVVFASYGGYWFAYAVTFTSFYGATAPYGNTSAPAYESTWAFFLLFMGLLSFIYLICSLRTNIMFVITFAGLTIGFLIEAGSYWNNAAGNTEVGSNLLVVAGAIYFVADLAAWWVLFSQLLQSVDFPIQIPVGDISHLIKGYSDRPKSSKGYPV